MRSYAENAARALHDVVQGLDESAARAAVKRLVALLAERGRLDLAPKVIAAYERLAQAAAGRLTVTTEAAVELPPDVSKALAQAVEQAAGRPAEVRATADPNLIGGAVIRYGDVLLDDSVLRKLERLKTSMTS